MVSYFIAAVPYLSDLSSPSFTRELHPFDAPPYPSVCPSLASDNCCAVDVSVDQTRPLDHVRWYALLQIFFIGRTLCIQALECEKMWPVALELLVMLKT